MHDPEKSDSGIVATKPTNKAGRPAEEPAEPRPGTKGNADQQSTHRTQSRARVTQALDRVREAARRRKKGQFTALLHHIDADTLRTAFYALKRKAAPGVDGMAWHDYEADLEPRIDDLHGRVHRGAYRPQPSRRTYIPKADGKHRPLAIAALEDKIVQGATVMALNRIKGLLFSQGASGYEPLRRDRRARLDAIQTGDGRRLPQHLKAQVCRELDRLELLLEQIKAVEAERDALLDAEQTKASAPPPMLLGVHGVGPEFASVLWSEGLSRHFDNRRQVAAYAGLAPTPWQSGSVNREQGISQSGNSRLRTTMIQLAWLWLRHQPRSALTLWFHDRVQRNGGRLRKTTIVALARKLLVALWKYVTAGVVIEGAIITTA